MPDALPPLPEGPSVEPEDDVERTEEELADVLATGNQVEVFLGENLALRVTLDRVDLFVRVTLGEDTLPLLRTTLEQGRFTARLPTMEAAVSNEGLAYVDSGELALLGRVLAARARLTGA